MCVTHNAFEARKTAKHISSFHSALNVFIYEKHIIYVFVLFSHNFIINAYHHYCSYSISHSSVPILLPDIKLFCFIFFWSFSAWNKFGSWETKRWRGKFSISRDFHISKGRLSWYVKGLKRFFSRVKWTLPSWFQNFICRIRHVTSHKLTIW